MGLKDMNMRSASGADASPGSLSTSNVSPHIRRRTSGSAMTSFARSPESPNTSRLYSASPRVATVAQASAAALPAVPRLSSSRPSTPVNRTTDDQVRPWSTDHVDVTALGSDLSDARTGPDALLFWLRVQLPDSASRRRTHIRLQKTWSDLVALQEALMRRCGGSSNSLALSIHAPDKALFEPPYLPWRLAERNAAIDDFLNSIQRLPLAVEEDWMPFFTTAMPPEPPPHSVYGACLRQEALLRQVGDGWAFCRCSLYPNTLLLQDPMSTAAPVVLDLRRTRIGRQTDILRGAPNQTARTSMIVLQSMLPSSSLPDQIKLAAESQWHHAEWMNLLLRESGDHSADRSTDQADVAMVTTPSTPGRETDTSSERSHATSTAHRYSVSPQSPQLTDMMRHVPAMKSRLRPVSDANFPHVSHGDRRRFLFGLLPLGGSDDTSHKHLFGAPLSEAAKEAGLLVDPSLSPVPAVVKRCIDMLETTEALHDEGLYRVSGSSSAIKVLQDRFVATGDVDLAAEYAAQRTKHGGPLHDPHVVAGLLKTYLRALPENLCTDVLLPEFCAAAELHDRDERLRRLRQLLDVLPAENFSTLRLIGAHLTKVHALSHVNKMTLHNLCIVFSATLSMPNDLVMSLLADFDWLFALPRHAPVTFSPEMLVPRLPTPSSEATASSHELLVPTTSAVKSPMVEAGGLPGA